VAGDLPSAVLFACSHNEVRSPMAAGLMRHFYGHKVYVRSAGVKPGKIDPLVTEVMDELGIDITKHRPKGFDDLEDTSFDVVISLSPEAHHRALEMTRTMAVDAEYWPTMDPSAFEGSRDQMLESYRGVRDGLMKRIRQRFGEVSARGV
jgi:protein-tyrosine-phosphatase